MATELYRRVISYNHGDVALNELVRKVWSGTPWMTDVFTESPDTIRNLEICKWCCDQFGREAAPIHEQAGDWHRGLATIYGWTWFGFRTEDQMLRFIERWPSPDKDEVSA